MFKRLSLALIKTIFLEDESPSLTKEDPKILINQVKLVVLLTIAFFHLKLANKESEKVNFNT